MKVKKKSLSHSLNRNFDILMERISKGEKQVISDAVYGWIDDFGI